MKARVCLSIVCVLAWAFVFVDAHASTPVQIAITVDDLPVHDPLPPGITHLEVANQMIAALKAAHAPKTYGFVNAVHVERDPVNAAVLSAWHAAGFPLGNHTWTHPNLNDLTVEAFTREITKNEMTLEQYSKRSQWHWFRYPFLSEGNDSAKRIAIREVLAKRGYKIAAVTMSFGDYMWNDSYARCSAKQDAASIAQLERLYLTAAEQSLEQSRFMSNALYSRDIPYVLLMHVSAFSAHMMPQLLDFYKRKEVRLVTLDAAERDPVYASDINPALPPQPSDLEARMQARGLALPARDATLPALLDKLCR